MKLRDLKTLTVKFLRNKIKIQTTLEIIKKTASIEAVFKILTNKLNFYY